MKFGNGVRIFLCTIMLVFLLMGCKSTRTIVDTKIKADSTIKMDVSAKSVASSTINQANAVRDLTVTSENITETVTQLLWTAPDSSGKQYVISKTVTVRSRNAQQASNIVKNETTTGQSKNSNILKDKSERKADYKSAVTTDTKSKIGTPGVINSGVLILVLAVIMIIVLILKKFKLL